MSFDTCRDHYQQNRSPARPNTLRPWSPPAARAYVTLAYRSECSRVLLCSFSRVVPRMLVCPAVKKLRSASGRKVPHQR
jgi:hypothetical protein